MRRLCLFLAFCTSVWANSGLRVLVDRPGLWEAEWSSAAWTVQPRPDGSVRYSNPFGLPPTVPGDLDASRLSALIALPAVGDWALSIPLDSGSERSPSHVARVNRWDPARKVFVEAPPTSPATTSLETKDGFRLLRLDLPLARLQDGGKIRLTEKLRLRLEWTGSARLRSGSIWAGVVDNPGGLQVFSGSGAFRSLRRAATDSLAGNMAVFEIGDTALFSSREDGVVRLTGKQVADALGIDVRGIRLSNIAVWSGPTDTLRSKADSIPNAPALRPIPILRRDAEHDDVFDPSDEILFWAHGPNVWLPDSSSEPGWSYLIHPYARKRRYVIRWDATKGSPDLGAARSGANPVTFDLVPQPIDVGRPISRLERLSGENDATKDLGIGWFWKSASGGSTLALLDSSRAGLPQIASDTGWLKIRVARSGELSGDATLFDQATIAGGGAWAARPSGDPYQAVFTGRNLSANAAFQVVLGGGSATKMGVMDYQVIYLRDVSGLDSALFPAPASGAVAIRAKEGTVCWALENGVAVRACQVQGGYLRDSVGVPGTWYALFPFSTRGLRPTLAKWTSATGSHVVRDVLAARQADILVVAPRQFLGVAEQYAKHREASFQVRPAKVAILGLEDIYDLWSGGMADPVAIRDAIRWAATNWKISNVLLLGNGHADPRNVLGASPESILPHWQYLEPRDRSNSSESTDDFYAGLVCNGAWAGDVAVGRIPARTVAEAQAWMDKLVVFEDPAKAEFGPWRNRFVFTADDMKQTTKIDQMNHTEEVEIVLQGLDGVRPWVRLDKVYMVQYPVNALGQKPEAARDLQTILNQGVAGMCYLGHGGMSLLADENLLDIPAIDRTLKNATHPFIFTAGSCTVGRNDLPNARGLAEVLVVAPGKGSFATVAATRPTYPDPNRAFMTELWLRLASGTGGTSLGTALLKAKLSTLNGVNNARYNLLGDPAMVPFPGGLEVKPDSISDTLAAFSRLSFTGKLGADGGVQPRMEIPQGNDSVIVEYTGSDRKVYQEKQVFQLPAQQFLSTLATSSAKAYAVTVGLPARVPFGSEAVVKTYAWDPKTRRDGGARSGRKVFWGTSKAGFGDLQGPEIVVRPCDSSWTGGVSFAKQARFPLPFCLAIDVRDTSGVSFDQGPDEGTVLALPGVREAWHPDLRQVADYRAATANLILDSTLLQPGSSYPLDVSARDLMGNLSKARVLLEPQQYEQPNLYEVFNSPNPVREGTTTAFYFKLSADADTNGSVDSRATASIRIHTVSGKLVRILRTELSNASSRLPRAIWDLRDSHGNPLANGLYPYTVLFRVPTFEGGGTIQREAKGVVAISR